MIALIAAMSTEVEAALALASNYEKIREKPFTLYRACLADKDVLICRCGIGKVEAAMTTSFLASNYPIELLVNIGCAAGLDPAQEVGDLVLSSAATYHDLFFYPETPRKGTENYVFSGDATARDAMYRVLRSMNRRVHVGTIVSGDQFVSSAAQTERILSLFPEAIALDMESAAIAHVATMFEIPFVVLRALSDIAVHEDNASEFELFEKKAAASSATACQLFLETWRSE